MQVQIQALLVAIGGSGNAERGATGSNIGPHIEVAKLAMLWTKAQRVKQ